MRAFTVIKTSDCWISEMTEANTNLLITILPLLCVQWWETKSARLIYTNTFRWMYLLRSPPWKPREWIPRLITTIIMVVLLMRIIPITTRNNVFVLQTDYFNYWRNILFLHNKTSFQNNRIFTFYSISFFNKKNCCTSIRSISSLLSIWVYSA